MTSTEKIIRNVIQCRRCWDIIESYAVYDCVTCTCGTVSIDGGHKYLKRTFKNSPDDYEELSELQ